MSVAVGARAPRVNLARLLWHEGGFFARRAYHEQSKGAQYVYFNRVEHKMRKNIDSVCVHHHTHPTPSPNLRGMLHRHLPLRPRHRHRSPRWSSLARRMLKPKQRQKHLLPYLLRLFEKGGTGLLCRLTEVTILGTSALTSFGRAAR